MKVILLLIAMVIDVPVNQILNPNYREFYKCQDEEVLLWGGAGAGKSYAIADKLLIQPYHQPDISLRALVIRKTFPSLRVTALEILKERARTLHIAAIPNKQEWTLQVQNLKINFLSLNNKDDFEKLRSMTDIDFIWFNELMELRETDYDEALRRLRGGHSFYQQVMSDFNPVDMYSWVHERFFEKNVGDVRKLHYTVYDNHPNYLKTEKAQKYIDRLKRTREYNRNIYNVFFKGEWGSLEGLIYNWDIVPLPDIQFDEVFYGGDFGFTVDPAAVVKIYRKGTKEFWVQELIYKTGLTNKYLGIGLRNRSDIDHTQPSYWDAAEPKSIQELFDMGINAKPSSKGADSVKAGIDYLQSLKIHVVDGSENIIKEMKTYVWQKDKNDNPTNKPTEFNNHLMDAIRYGIYTHMKEGTRIPHFGGF